MIHVLPGWRNASKLILLVALGIMTISLAKPQDVLTWHNDAARTGQNLGETILTPSNVNPTSFGKRFVIPVDGKVDAQPLYLSGVAIPGKGMHDVLVVATEHDSLYAFDADTGAQLWHTSLLPTGEAPSDDRGCSQVTPEIGITSTPVIDRTMGPNGTIFAVTMSKDGAGHYHHRIHSVDLTTGLEQVIAREVQATYTGSGAEGDGSHLTFDPKQHKDRSALAIINGVVYTSWGSHCDAPPYTGWVIGYNGATLARVSVLNLTPNGNDGGIWAAGSGPAVDDAGNLYLLMGNGTFDTSLTPGMFPVNGDYGNALVKIATTEGSLAVTDYFTMSNTVMESDQDADLSSGGVMLMPSVNDAGGHPVALAVGAGKDQHVYVVDRTNLGKFHSTVNSIYQDLTFAVGGSVFSSPAWFNGNLYYGAAGATLRAFAFVNGAFSSAPASQSSQAFGYPGTTPSISANGAANGIVWTAENGNPAVLHAYDAGNLATELYNSNQAAGSRDHFGVGNKYIVPTVMNGKVYVGTTSGVGVFGLLNQVSQPPAVVAALPSAGSGLSQAFTFTFSDPGGWQNLGILNVLINGVIDGRQSCYFALVPSTASSGSIFLVDDAGDAGGPFAGSFTVPGSGSASNGQCSLSASGSSVATDANNLTLTISLTFAPGFTGNKVLFMAARDTASENSGWQAMGTWAVPGLPPSGPSVGGMSPERGASAAQTYTFTFTDTNSWQDLAVLNVLINSAIDGINACYLAYTPSSATTGSISLVDDAGDAGGPFAGTFAVPGNGPAQNSQCSVGGASAVASGNTLTLTLSITFNHSFAGNRIFSLASRSAAVSSGWQAVGSVAVP